MSERKLQLGGWRLTSTEFGACPVDGQQWISLEKLTTVNDLLADKRLVSSNPYQRDWWYETNFEKSENTQHSCLNFEGLAANTEILVNGETRLLANNEFRPHQLNIDDLSPGMHRLTLRCGSLTPLLEGKKPRPRWRTALANNHFRWLRSTLLGSITGWSNQGRPLGVWGAVSLARNAQSTVRLIPGVRNKVATLTVVCNDSADIRVSVGDSVVAHKLDAGEPGYFQFPELELWSPHTHGHPALHTVKVDVSSAALTSFSIEETLGFREVVLLNEKDVSFEINGRPVFLRGACWTHSDVRRYRYNPEKAERILRRAQLSGINAIRIGGTMTYEDEHFYRLCSELGILVWQDFMFANMDYPSDDADFVREVERELEHQITRLGRYACVAVFCGNSEVDQQAAMLGLEADAAQNSLFTGLIPNYLQRLLPGAIYFSSSPVGGSLPFQTNTGLSHYFGLGAYKKGEEDLKSSDIKFTPECLGHSHLPSKSVASAIFGSEAPPPHLPLWKSGVPRDTGTGWDFEDIRDYYVSNYFEVEAVELRSRDLAKYHQYSRVITGFLLSQAFNYWRSSDSACSGALTWWLNDLVPGAGWGLFDSEGGSKPALYILQPSFQPISIALIPNGLNGHRLSCINEGQELLSGVMTIQLINTRRHTVTSKDVNYTLAAGVAECTDLNEMLGSFLDTTNAYGFGTEPNNVVAVRWVGSDGALLSESVQFPLGLKLPTVYEADKARLSVEPVWDAGECYLVIISQVFTQFCEIEGKGWETEENYFHLLPGEARRVKITGSPSGRFKGVLTALNLAFSKRITLDLERPES